MKIPSIVLLSFVFFAISVSAQSEERKAKIRKEITNVLTEQTAAWNRGDIDGFMKGYWRSPRMTFVSGNTVSKGWNAALERYKRRYATREKMGVLSFTGLLITVIDKRSAFVLGRFTLVRKVDEPTGLFTLVFRKTQDGWKVVHDHTSS